MYSQTGGPGCAGLALTLLSIVPPFHDPAPAMPVGLAAGRLLVATRRIPSTYEHNRHPLLDCYLAES